MKYTYPKKNEGLEIETTIECRCGKKFVNRTKDVLFPMATHTAKQLFYDFRAWLHVKARGHKIAEKYDIF